MKVILSIGGYGYRLPATADAAVILKQLAGARRVDHATHYGPDNDRYHEGEYFSGQVVADEMARISVELVDDDALFTKAEWARKESEADMRILERTKPSLPAAA